MKLLRHTAIFLALLLAFTSCDRKPKKEKKLDKVLIMYAAGFNDLSSDLISDVSDLSEGQLPAKGDDKVLVVIAHTGSSKPTSPNIIRLYKNSKGTAVRDTIATFPSDQTLTNPEVMKNMLNYVAENFKSESYGLIFSSHATGWLPAGYYEKPNNYILFSNGTMNRAPAKFSYPTVVPYVASDLPGPRVKSVGAEYEYVNDVKSVREMTLQDFSYALPYHFDYILFDACFMGCVEAAYELKDKCDYIGFSPTEILSDGLNYKTLTTHLLKPGKPDIQSVGQEFYDQYACQTGSMQSATFSIVDCRKVDDLASVCNGLFDKYRDQIASVKASEVQRYFRSNKHWFYDLEDILVKSGISDSEKATLSSALSSCVIFKVHTPKFMPADAGFEIKTYSGLSMYLPCKGDAYLDDFYKPLGWNRATGLVR